MLIVIVEEALPKVCMKKIALLGLIGFVLTGCGDKCDSDVGAFVMSQNFVKKKLKYPSSAVFPYIDDSAVYVYGDIDKEGLEICEYSVHGYVESKNSFGVMVNNKYTVDLKYNVKNDTWSAAQVFIQ